ncbi:helix-turn-helix domain-containing protein [Streptomyces qinzhouensis]|uniref:PucR family transcriptional regulator n=1 Tax=Streptomyces qinzhouensis TaxID=2599401 RepID=A0A5B8IRD3_9ACTN|nr:helix-turn-helix domain-containing protein [Streptomyces qinzhouensis]QDY80199.1 PucR family transcriptional regulator [Streptomyces qinzhouensis]
MRPPSPSRPGPFAPPPELPEAVPAGGEESGAVLRYAGGLLRPVLPDIVRGAVAELRSASAYYGDPVLAPADLAESARDALDVFVGGLIDRERTAESGEHAWRTGQRRAADGVPLRAVLHAYRIGGTRLWEALVSLVVRERPDRAPALAYAASDVWRRVDRDTALLAEAHRRAAAGLPDLALRRHRPVLRMLLRGHADPVHVSAFAVSLGLPPAGRYAVALLAGPGTARAETDPMFETRDGVPLYWCPLDDATAVVAHLGDRPELPAGLIPVGPAGRGGVSTVVDGLAELGRGHDLARLALAACPADGTLHRLGDRLSLAFAVARPDLAAAVADRVLGPLRTLDPAERAELLTTLAAWLDRGGSTRRAGELLYCHRNTVLNRLRRLERLTGRTLANPRDLVDLAMALDAEGVAAPDLKH